VEGAMVAVRGQDRIDHSAGELFEPPGYARFDLYAWAEPRPGIRINAGLLNLGDRRYSNWSGVRGLAADEDNIGFYTRPGRSAAVNVSFDW
ncbi:MAG TPA: TonB-dependent receptor, partial [Luteimonas sp.]|nr:TonB-dependent receptor [Luteimonas sp.]